MFNIKLSSTSFWNLIINIVDLFHVVAQLAYLMTITLQYCSVTNFIFSSSWIDNDLHSQASLEQLGQSNLVPSLYVCVSGFDIYTYPGRKFAVAWTNDVGSSLLEHEAQLFELAAVFKLCVFIEHSAVHPGDNSVPNSPTVGNSDDGVCLVPQGSATASRDWAYIAHPLEPCRS